MMTTDLRVHGGVPPYLRPFNSMLRPSIVGLGTLAAMLLGGPSAFAAGCEGQNATSDSGGRSLELSQRIQEEVLDRAKANSGIGVNPVYGGMAVTGSRLQHDGYRLKTAIPQTDCAGAPIDPITRLQKFDTETWSATAIGEVDVTRSMGLAQGSLLKLGFGVGGKWLSTNYSGNVRTPAAPATIGAGPPIGVNAGTGTVEESGVQLDFYSLLAMGSAYFTLATSVGFGDSDVRNARFTGQEFIDPNNLGLGTRVGVFGGGRGNADYTDVNVSGVIGNVFTLGTHGSARTLLDLSGGLLYSNYHRDGFTDSARVRYSSASTEEFSGKIEAKLAYQFQQGSDVWTPYLKAGVKHRFTFDSDVTVFNPTTGLCALGPNGCDFTARYNVKSDDTFWRIGGGLGGVLNGGNLSGVIELMYQGSGDTSGVIGKGQVIMKLN